MWWTEISILLHKFYSLFFVTDLKIGGSARCELSESICQPLACVKIMDIENYCARLSFIIIIIIIIIIITIIIIIITYLLTAIELSPGGSSPTLVQTKIKIHKTTK